MSHIILKHANGNSFRGVTHLFWGIDVGIRNLGIALVGHVPAEVHPRLIYLGLHDLGADAVHDDDALFNLLVERLGELHDHIQRGYTSGNPYYGAIAIETQQKQTEEARMIMMAGAIKTVFVMRNPGIYILNQSPSCITCVDMQRYINLPDPKAVSQRAEKKQKVNEMMDHWLRRVDETHTLNEVNSQLRLKRKNGSGAYLKGGDRRDHVGDALFQALYALKKKCLD